MTQKDLQNKALFITIEGIGGAGKTTISEFVIGLVREVRPLNDVIRTSEPGGTDTGLKIREALLAEDMQPITEALLLLAARKEHIDKLILPETFRGNSVVCERFNDSTYAYQGYGGGVQITTINNLIANTSCNVTPDITFLLDLPVSEAEQRLKARDYSHRFNQKDSDYMERVRAGYLSQADHHWKRIVVIDASQDLASVKGQIEIKFQEKFGVELS